MSTASTIGNPDWQPVLVPDPSADLLVLLIELGAEMSPVGTATTFGAVQKDDSRLVAALSTH